MSQYPDALSDLAWFRQQIEGLQAEVRELQRGPAVPQPTLLFGTYAAMVAVVGKALQRAWVDVSTESVVGRRGEWVYRPGTGWVRPWITGEVVWYRGSSVPADCVPASGASYAVADYPDLAAKYGISSGTFTVDNLGGRVVVGAGTVADANGTIRTFAVGDKGGELSHALSAPENGPHAHGSFGHMYTSYQSGWYSGSSTLLAIGGFFGVDPATTVSGAGAPHNILQPYTALNVALRI